MDQAFIVDLELTPDRELSTREVSRWLREALARSAKPCPIHAFGLSVQSAPPILPADEDEDAPRETEIDVLMETDPYFAKKIHLPKKLPRARRP